MDERLRDQVLAPNWPGVAGVSALMTLRSAPPGIGASQGLFAAADGRAGFNLGRGSGEELAIVEANRRLLARAIGREPCWLNQVHGTGVAAFSASPRADSTPPDADAAWTQSPGVALSILVADCMPVLFAERSGRCIGAAHAGWRGLAAGVLEATLNAMPAAADQFDAWLGPAIGPLDFEVGQDVLDAFVRSDAKALQGFVPGRAGKWFANLGWLARLRLERLGVRVYGTPASTVADPARFYSFRRDRVTGRMAALIWLDTDMQ